MVTQNLPDAGGGLCADLLSCAALEFAALALGTVLFALAFAAAALHVRDARTAVDEERSLLRVEADAFAAFASKLADLDAAGTTSGPVGPGATALVSVGTTAGLEGVRRAYEETVMAVPHYEAEYDEPLPANMAVEFGDDVASAVASGGPLTPQLKSTLLERSRQAASKRLVLLEYLDEEAEVLEAAAADLERVADSVERVAREPLERAGYDELRAEWYLLDDRERECEAVLDDRQDAIQNRGGLTERVEDVDTLEEYLYEPLSVTYPVLADGAALLERLRAEKQRVAGGLARSA